jgi:hypothetical protein
MLKTDQVVVKVKDMAITTIFDRVKVQVCHYNTVEESKVLRATGK